MVSCSAFTLLEAVKINIPKSYCFKNIGIFSELCSLPSYVSSHLKTTSVFMLACTYHTYIQTDTHTLTQCTFIHTHKTAKLIAASLKMGAIIANLSLDMQKFLYDFGLVLGLYFQIRDDIIDSIQDESISGKTANNDTNKNSYVNLMGLNGAKNALKEHGDLLQKDLEKLQTLGYDRLYANLNELLESYLKPLD